MATASTAIATGMDAVYYMSKDLKRVRSFYENVLGVKPAWESDMDGGQWIEYELADGSTFGLGHMSGSEFHSSGGVMFAVPDVRESLERAKAAGATVVFDYLETPACQMAWCLDTEGNSFCLHHRTAQASG